MRFSLFFEVWEWVKLNGHRAIQKYYKIDSYIFNVKWGHWESCLFFALNLKLANFRNFGHISPLFFIYDRENAKKWRFWRFFEHLNPYLHHKSVENVGWKKYCQSEGGFNLHGGLICLGSSGWSDRRGDVKHFWTHWLLRPSLITFIMKVSLHQTSLAQHIFEKISIEGITSIKFIFYKLWVIVFDLGHELGWSESRRFKVTESQI